MVSFKKYCLGYTLLILATAILAGVTLEPVKALDFVSFNIGQPDASASIVEHYWESEAYAFVWLGYTPEEVEYWKTYVIQLAYQQDYPETVNHTAETFHLILDITLIIFTGFFIAGAVDSIEWLKMHGFWHGWYHLLFS